MSYITGLPPQPNGVYISDVVRGKFYDIHSKHGIIYPRVLMLDNRQEYSAFGTTWRLTFEIAGGTIQTAAIDSHDFDRPPYGPYTFVEVG